MIDKYIRELLEANQTQNLISRQIGGDEIWEHVTDSQSLLPAMDLTGCEILDMGSGQGFPAIPLALACSEARFILVESDLKKSKFLKSLSPSLGLTNVTVSRLRVEDMGQSPEYRDRFDVVTCRAVAGMPTILEWGLPLLGIGGWLVAWKGIRVDEELEESRNALEILGGGAVRVRTYEVGNRRRSLVFVKKERECPPQYPRRGGLAKKRPLI